MKEKKIHMFFILQLLLVITNLQNINNTLFSIDLSNVLMIIIIIFVSLYVLFISKSTNTKKISFLAIMILLCIGNLFDDNSVNQLITNEYYFSTFSFLLFYYFDNMFDRFKIILISLLSLIVLDFIILFNNQINIEIELFVNILLAISFGLYNSHKKVLLPIYLLTILISTINDMSFVLYNSLLISVICLLSYRNKKDILYGFSLIIISIGCLLYNGLFSFSKLLNTFDTFYVNINLSSSIIVIPLIVLVSYLIVKYIMQKRKNLELNIELYLSVLITSLMFISLNNVYNELIMVFYSLLIILIIDKLKTNSKDLKKEITFFVLHLGYGGIESSTINTSNELSKIYDVNIISLYTLNRNIESTIDKKVKIKHLYNGEPNKEELFDAIKNKRIVNIIKEGFKSVYILFLKDYLIIKEMYNCNSLYVVSTRNEFSSLLSEYGNSNAVKIAQEHMHHRDNKKYINNIKYEFNNINYMFALTKSLKDDYENFLKNNQITKVVIVPNIIHLPKKKSKLNKNLITISRLNSIKKIEDMIEIFSKIKSKKSKLYIVGDGDELEKLKKVTNRLNLNDRVIFTGYKTKEEMEEYILDSCIFLLTSWSEGLPMVLLESMSYGVPCIAFKTKSGVSDIIDNNVNGFIIEKRNQEKYVEKIDELMNNKELLNEFSKNSIIKAKRFTSKNIIKKWQEVLENEKE